MHRTKSLTYISLLVDNPFHNTEETIFLCNFKNNDRAGCVTP